MTIKKIKLTEHSIKSFKKQDKTYNVWDTVESNLYISVTKKSKTYIFYKKTPLKQVRKHIGNVKDIKLKNQLMDYLDVYSGGIIFSTMQKFSPQGDRELMDVISHRDDIIVIADEAHRSQYGLMAKTHKDGSTTYGHAKHLRDSLPNANFIGFTGTPIDKKDKSTVLVFGEYIHVYNMSKAVEDGVTVDICHENRFIPLNIDPTKILTVNDEYNEIMVGVEEYNAEKKKREFSNRKALTESPVRLKTLAKDLIIHWGRRRKALFGKSMVVCVSRKACVTLYDLIIKLNPHWHNEDKAQGKIKIIFTSVTGKDPHEWAIHKTTKSQREDLANRMKDETDELEMVIVCDMWLTGFDVPCLHTMYIDKPMQGHNLMQAIARVNRVFRDKQNGLVVDFIGLADDLKTALGQYSKADHKTASMNIDDVIQSMMETYEIVKNIFYPFDYSNYKSENHLLRSKCVLAGMNYILDMDHKNSEKEIKKNFINAVTALSHSHALCISRAQAQEINEEVAYFKVVKSTLIKILPAEHKHVLTNEEINQRMADMLGNTIVSEEIIDVYGVIGGERPNISVLSDEFLENVHTSEHKAVGVDVLRNMLRSNISDTAKKNVVVSETFSQRLENAVKQYNNKVIDSVQTLDNLVNMAKDFNEQQKHDTDSGLTEQEIPFYDILKKEDTSNKLNDDTLKKLAIGLVKVISPHVSAVDWHTRDSTRYSMKNAIKKYLRLENYPTANQEKAVVSIMEQARFF